MIEVLDQKLVFHPTVRTGNLLCKTGNFIAKSIGLAHREELNKESVGTLIPCIYRIAIGIEPLLRFS